MTFFQPLNRPITQWEGRSVWLIGASSGIGLATAQALHHAGARVTVSARHLATLQAFARAHAGAEAVALDVTDSTSVADAAQQVQAQHGLDVVVYCAGHYHAMRARDYDLAEMLRHQEVNYNGALRVLAEVLPPLLAQGAGHISLVASVAGFRGLPNSLAYGPTKAALINLTEALYYDLSPHGIGVSVVTPGFVKTPMTAHNDFAMPALISPAQAATALLRGWAQGAFQIDFPKRFTWWLKLLRVLPFRLSIALVRRATGL